VATRLTATIHFAVRLGTTSQFAPAAAAYANRIPQRRILIDGEKLTRLKVQYGVGDRTERNIEFRKLDLDYFEE
jgi:restriction system protein